MQLILEVGSIRDLVAFLYLKLSQSLVQLLVVAHESFDLGAGAVGDLTEGVEVLTEFSSGFAPHHRFL